MSVVQQLLLAADKIVTGVGHADTTALTALFNGIGSLCCLNSSQIQDVAIARVAVGHAQTNLGVSTIEPDAVPAVNQSMNGFICRPKNGFHGGHFTRALGPQTALPPLCPRTWCCWQGLQISVIGCLVGLAERTCVTASTTLR